MQCFLIFPDVNVTFIQPNASVKCDAQFVRQGCTPVIVYLNIFLQNYWKKNLKDNRVDTKNKPLDSFKLYCSVKIVIHHRTNTYLYWMFSVKRVLQNAKKVIKYSKFFSYSTAYNNKLLNRKHIIVLNFCKIFGTVGFTENYRRIVRIF